MLVRPVGYVHPCLQKLNQWLIMQRQDKLMLFFLTKSFENIPDSDKEKGKNARFAAFVAFLILLCLFLTGSEAVRVVLRKRTGEGEISYIRLFLTLLLFALLGIVLLSYSTEIAQHPGLGFAVLSKLSVTVTGIFYISFSGLLIFLGIYNKLQAQKLKLPDMYPGNSRFLGYVEKRSGLRRSCIRNLFDPLLFLVGGFIGFFINPFLGLPLMVCSVSYWIVFCVEFTIGFEKERLAAITEYEGAKNVVLNNRKDISSIQQKW